MTDYGTTVLDAHNALFNGDTSVLDTAFADDFVEHSPLVAGDKDGLRTMVDDAGDNLSYTNARVLSDGNMVALHGKFTGLDDDNLVGFDIYRVNDDGKLAEHWDSLVPEAEPNASGRTQLDGPTVVDRTADTEANRTRAVEYFNRALIGGDYEAFRDYTKDGVFRQHSPDIADGTDEVITFLNGLRDEGSGLQYDKLHNVVADGQFVLTHSEGSIAGDRHNYIELWHWDPDGSLSEMWDAISPVPADSEALHGHGIF